MATVFSATSVLCAHPGSPSCPLLLSPWTSLTGLLLLQVIQVGALPLAQSFRVSNLVPKHTDIVQRAVQTNFYRVLTQKFLAIVAQATSP